MLGLAINDQPDEQEKQAKHLADSAGMLADSSAARVNTHSDEEPVAKQKAECLF